MGTKHATASKKKAEEGPRPLLSGVACVLAFFWHSQNPNPGWWHPSPPPLIAWEKTRQRQPSPHAPLPIDFSDEAHHIPIPARIPLSIRSLSPYISLSLCLSVCWLSSFDHRRRFVLLFRCFGIGLCDAAPNVLSQGRIPRRRRRGKRPPLPPPLPLSFLNFKDTTKQKKATLPIHRPIHPSTPPKPPRAAARGLHAPLPHPFRHQHHHQENRWCGVYRLPAAAPALVTSPSVSRPTWATPQVTQSMSLHPGP